MYIYIQCGFISVIHACLRLFLIYGIANERTFLAWLRTSLSLVTVGVGKHECHMSFLVYIISQVTCYSNYTAL